jgi:galactokinase
MTDVLAAASQVFLREFGRPPAALAYAPGRVNLIGEHTDYNDGFVLPMAIEVGIGAAFAPNRDGTLRIRADELGETREISLEVAAQNPAADPGWFGYGVGMVWALAAAGRPLAGTTIALVSTLPVGAGLSSSAALQIVIARALAATAGSWWEPREVAVLAQRAEHAITGVASGIMDQMAVACGKHDRALLLDCRSLTIEDVVVPEGAAIVIVDSGVERALSGSAYNERRAACERAVAAIRQLDPAVGALRDVDFASLQRARGRMDDEAFRRASHVVAEIARPRRFAAALQCGDLPEAGRLMVESHASLRDLYEVSRSELDLLVTLAAAEEGCHGARLTGAGFGGCIVALVDQPAVSSFSASVSAQYAVATGLRPRVIVSRPAAGARLVGQTGSDLA